MSRLLRELVDADVKLAATSNTLPDALGEGRFAADDFRREIQGLASRFEVVRIEGEDYRHRGLPRRRRHCRTTASRRRVRRPARSHPRRLRRACWRTWRRCIRAGTAPCWTASSAVGLRGVHGLTDQEVALRLVVLADRLYDRDIPLLAERRAARPAVQRRHAAPAATARSTGARPCRGSWRSPARERA